MTQKDISNYIKSLHNQRVDKISLIIQVLSCLSFEELQMFHSKMPRMFQGLLKVPYLKRKQYADIFKKGKILWKDCVDVYGAIAFIIQNNAECINHYLNLKHSLDYAT